jgi:hypothetical protein
MGGKLIPNSTRMPKALHDALRSKVQEDLLQVLPHIKTGITEALRSKADFGDIDIIVDKDSLGPWPIEELRAALKSAWNVDDSTLNAQVAYENNDPKNGRTLLPQNRGVLSFGLPANGVVHQVDLIVVPNLYFDITRQYFDWGGIGNLIGRAASKMGFAVGIEGLQFREVLEDLNRRDAVLISADYNDILTFLGLDPGRFAEGFDTMVDVFDYVVTSPLFDPQLFLPQNRNHDKRVRDERHPLHVAFLEWLDKTGKVHQASPAWAEDKTVYVELARTHFPEFDTRMKDRDEALVRERAARHTPFGGDEVRDILGLPPGPTVGAVLRHLRAQWGEDETFRTAWQTGDEASRKSLLETRAADAPPPEPLGPRIRR